MTHGSLFAGIGGFDLGFERAGIKTTWMVEIDKYCQKVLASHFPDAKLYGDVTELNAANLDRVDIISAGFPCQDLSIAGKRKGLKGERSGLFFKIVRFLEGLRPAWVVLENVPGLLSSNSGRDFAVVLGSLAECGYGVSWRILDSQFFGVPQRRRRVFIVGSFGRPCPPEILFEPESGRRNTQKGRKTGSEIAYCLRERPSHSGDKGDGGLNTTLIAGTLESGGDTKRGWKVGCEDARDNKLVVAPTLGASGAGTDRTSAKGNDWQFCIPIPYVAGFSGGQSAKARSLGYREEQSPTIRGTESGTNQVPNVCQTSNPDGVRETSGIPRQMDYPDSPRYRALGNAVTVNVAEWIGRRIMAQVGK